MEFDFSQNFFVSLFHKNQPIFPDYNFNTSIKK